VKLCKFLSSVGLIACICGPASAQPSEPWENEGQSLTEDSGTGNMTYEWWGKAGRTYFIQSSEDLMSWSYIPIIEPGIGEWIEWGFSTTADSLFLRLRFSDISMADPLTFDLDGDDIGNWDELLQETDPFAALDLDENTLPDDWELFWNSEIAVFPASLDLILDWGGQESVSLYLNNPTTSAASYSVTVSGDTVAGYSWEDSLTGTISYSWTDISATGTHMTAISDVNNDSQAIQLTQFVFPYYGRDYSEVWVSSNGYLNFKAESNDSSNEGLPDMGQPYGMIAPFWDDLHTSEAGDVYQKEEATRLIVQYEAVKHDNYTGTNSFQVILNADGSIEFHYKEMGGSNLNSSSVGIENIIGNQGIQLRANSDASNQITLQDNYGIRFNPTKTLYTLSPLSGSAAPNSVSEIISSFDTGNLIPGTYNGSIAFTHDGPGTSPWDVPVEVRIPYAKITDPSSGYWLYEGETISSTGAYLRARVLDTPDDIDKVEFRFGDSLIGTDSTASNDQYQVNWSNVPAGEHQVYARVVLDNGQTNDSRPILIEVTPDSDGDRIDDRWEEQMVSADSNDSVYAVNDVDALDDFDGDGFSNIFEYHHGTDPVDPGDTPSFAVQDAVSPDPEVGEVHYFKVYSGAPNSGYEWTTINAAVQAAEDFDVIEVSPGVYNEEVSAIRDDIYLFSSEGAGNTILDGANLSDNIIDVRSKSVIEGFTIRDGGSTHTVNNGAGMFVDLSDSDEEARIVRCVFANNQSIRYGGAVYVYRGSPHFVSCTFAGNEALQGDSIYSRSDSNGVHVRNSILSTSKWDFSEVGGVGGNTNGSTIESSIFTDPVTGNLSVDGMVQSVRDPGLTPWFGIYADSPARDAGVGDFAAPSDMDDEHPVDGLLDIGADEYIDADGDDMADSWEDYYGLGDPNGHADADELTNLEEYQNRTNPLVDDTDGDGVSDSDEVTLTLTNPAVPDIFGADGDSNNDGLDDGIGFNMGIGIGQTDSDGDGLSNDDEHSLGTNPFLADTDGDGENDAIDPFPLDAFLDSSDFTSDPGDTNAPVFLLTKPTEATEI